MFWMCNNIFLYIEDKAFLDMRCQGLGRFINCVVRHPVLKNDAEVVSFLTEQTVRS